MRRGSPALTQPLWNAVAPRICNAMYFAAELLHFLVPVAIPFSHIFFQCEAPQHSPCSRPPNGIHRPRFSAHFVTPIRSASHRRAPKHPAALASLRHLSPSSLPGALRSTAGSPRPVLPRRHPPPLPPQPRHPAAQPSLPESCGGVWAAERTAAATAPRRSRGLCPHEPQVPPRGCGLPRPLPGSQARTHLTGRLHLGAAAGHMTPTRRRKGGRRRSGRRGPAATM